MSTMRCCIDKAEMNHSGKDRFEIRGWIYSKKGREITAVVKADRKQDIPYKMVNVKRPDVQKALRLEDDSVKLGFVIYIKDISKLWNSFEELELSFTDSVETIEVYKEKFSKIQKLYEKSLIKYNIDSAAILEDMVRVKGWALYKNRKCPVTVWDSNGKEIKCEIEQEERPDVNCIFSINKSVECGFQIQIPKKHLSKGNLILLFQEENSEAKYSLSARRMNFENSTFGKYYKQLGPKQWKQNLLFLSRHGYREFRKELDKHVNPSGMGYGYWAKLHKVTKAELRQEAREHFAYEPLISIVIPLYNTPLSYLEELLQSIIGQTYPNWQLCLADGSPKDQVQRYLEENHGKENRITYERLKKNGGISENTNQALHLAKGEYIMLSDHDDVLERNALYEIVKAINSDKKPDIIYTDEDKVRGDGLEHFQPHFKPDFSPDLLRSNNYICHFFVARRILIEKIGGFSSAFDGAQDHDFIFRCTEQAGKIHHIPEILYHWRTHQSSTADNPESKLYAFEAGKRAVEANLHRCGLKGQVSHTKDYGFYRVKYQVQGTPLVSIIIPNKDAREDLEKCVHSILEKSTYQNIEILIVENNFITF